MKTDILNKDDIKQLIDAFYASVLKDDLIAHFFIQVVPVNWDKHLPVMYSFWENILFHSGDFVGNPMEAHLRLNSLEPMRHEHFERWISLFCKTVDEYFEGVQANLIKQRAISIATVMQIKIAQLKGS